MDLPDMPVPVTATKACSLARLPRRAINRQFDNEAQDVVESRLKSDPSTGI